MSKLSRERFAYGASTQQLRYGGAALAFMVGVLHLFHPKLGFPRLVLLLSADPALLLSDPRPIAFVLSGFAILAGVGVVGVGIPPRLLYVLGAALMLTYITGYFAWHLSGHGGFLPGREPLYHGMTPLQAVVSHLSGDLWAAAAIVTEVLLVGVLVILYRRES